MNSPGGNTSAGIRSLMLFHLPSVVVLDRNDDCDLVLATSLIFDDQPPLVVQAHRVLPWLPLEFLVVERRQGIERPFINGGTDLLHPLAEGLDDTRREPAIATFPEFQLGELVVRVSDLHETRRYTLPEYYAIPYYQDSIKMYLTMPVRLRILVSMKRLAREKRALILRCFTEGVGVNATARMADVSKNTVLKFLADLAPVCRDFQRNMLTNLKCERIQVDEIWAFTGMKAKNVPAELRGEWGIGDTWTWIGI